MQADAPRKLPKLRDLQFSPSINPLMEPREIQVKRRYVKTGRSEQLVNMTTGEVSGVAAHHQVEERDDAEFVKVFAAGIRGIYDLSRTASRVFQVVLDQYQREPMSGGFADSIYLVVRPIKNGAYQATPRSNLFQRNTTGDALISAMPFRMRCFRSSLDATRMCRKKVRAILEKAHSIKLSQEPCFGV